MTGIDNTYVISQHGWMIHGQNKIEVPVEYQCDLIHFFRVQLQLIHFLLHFKQKDQIQFQLYG